jgi:glycerol 3-phosphatase-2
MIGGHDVVLFDLDGVVFTGSVAVPHAVATIEALRERGVRCGFITNNAQRTPQQVADHLAQFGLAVDVADIVTSPMVAAEVLQTMIPAGSPVLVVGGAGVRDAVTDAGFRVVESADDEPAAVVQGIAPTICWPHLAEACYAIAAGARWIATNPDPSLPTERGFAPGNGAMVAAVAMAVGRGPDIVAGKPEPALFHAAARRLAARNPLMVGDRLDTDVAGGQGAGIRSALVLTGVTKQVGPDDPQPDLVLRDLRDLLALTDE